MTEQLEIPTWQPSMRMLSDEQLRAIHNTSLDILARTGIVMKNRHARELLLEAGAHETGDRIKIPEYLVMDAITSAPARIPLYNRSGEQSMLLEAGKVYFGSGSDCIYTIDLESGERRQARLEDVGRLARLCDSLEQIDFVMSMGVSADVPGLAHYVYEFGEMLRNTVKPLVFTASDRRDMEDIFLMATAVAGGEDALREKPFLLHYAEPISPLLFPEDSVDKLLFCAEKGLPVAFPPSPNTGGGGPITLAGALALGNAECLVGLLLTQLVRKGTPFLYGMNTATLDMQSAIISYGAPEWPTGMAACTDLGKMYNLPLWGVSGATDSKVIDAQAGIEATITIMTAFLTRTNLNHDVGYIEYGSTSSLEMLVVCDEIIRDVRAVMGGVEVSERTLAREAIHQVQPGSGFLATDHTLENWRWAQWRPKLLDRQRYDDWARKGSLSMRQRANDRARKLLASHEVKPLAPAVDEIIEEIRQRRA